MASNWPYALSGIPAAVASITAAYYGRQNRSSLKTGNEKSVGDMVTEIHGQDSQQSTPYDTHNP